MFYDVKIRCRRKIAFFCVPVAWCDIAYNVTVPVMSVPITKTFWRGKVGTRDFVACNVNELVTSVPVTRIYCIHVC